MAKLVTNANLQPRSSPGTYTTEALTEVIVTDVIMNDRHEYWSRLGGWDALGTIFFNLTIGVLPIAFKLLFSKFIIFII